MEIFVRNLIFGIAYLTMEPAENIWETCRGTSAFPRDLSVDQEPLTITITLRLAILLTHIFLLIITSLFILNRFLKLIFHLYHYSSSSHYALSTTHQQRSLLTMPRKITTVLLVLRVICAIVYTNESVLAPLPVEESDVDSAVEDVPATKAEVPKTNDEPADTTMKNGEDQEDDDDDDDDEDPETLV